MIDQLYKQRAIVQGVDDTSEGLLRDAKQGLTKRSTFDETKFHKDLVAGVFKDD